MKFRVFLAAAGIAAVGWVRVPAATALMPIDDVKAGMEGVGRTVFEGEKMEDFKVHILGVLKNVQGPKHDLILARLEGGPLAETGVIAGMSGSPVYVDGRLIGAVSFSIGSFPKEPIAGITPIGEMIEATDTVEPRPASASGRLDLPVTPDTFAAAVKATVTRINTLSGHPAAVPAFALPATAGAAGGFLRPIATPLVLGGMDAATVDLASSMFGSAGMEPVVASGGRGDVPASTEPLRAGDPVGVALLAGDAEMGATGTVTYVDGRRVYAFGHPFYNFGPIAFPMTRSYVYTSLPSLMSSFKIATMGDVIGTLQQDRATAIAGTLGKGPQTIPVDITLDSSRGRRHFHYQIVNDQLFTPLLSYLAVFDTLGSYERQFGPITFTVTGTTRFDRHPDLTFDDVFTGETPIPSAAASIAGPLTLLLANDVEPITIKGVDVTITTSEVSHADTIERVWIDDIQPRAGKTVAVKVLTRSYRGAEKVSTLPVEIPAYATGQLTLMVTDARALNLLEQMQLHRSVEPQSVDEMLKLLNQTRRNNRLYVRLLTGASGAVVHGEALTSLPPSVLSVLEGDRSSGDFAPIRSAALGEWNIAMGSAVSGTRVLTIDLR